MSLRARFVAVSGMCTRLDSGPPKKKKRAQRAREGGNGGREAEVEEEKRGRFSITVAGAAHNLETRYLSRGRGCNVENLLRYKAASYAKPK